MTSVPSFSTYVNLSNWDARVAKVSQEMGCNREMAQDILLRRIKAQKKHLAQTSRESEKQRKIAVYQQAQQRMLGERD